MFTIRPILTGLLFLLLGATLAGCNKDAGLAPTPPLEVVISQPVQEEISDWDVYTGRVKARESIEVRARVRGHIKDVLFKEGDEIESGAKLFVIDSEPFQADLKQAKGQLITWEAKLKLAEEKVAMYKPLAAKGNISKDEMAQVFSTKGEAIGGMDTAQGKIMEAETNIRYCKIDSPIAGRVGRALLTTGNLVTTTGNDNLLTTVVAVNPMDVLFDVNERAFLEYQKLQSDRFAKEGGKDGGKAAKPEIPVELALATATKYEFKGVIDFADNRVDPATGSLKVRARFENPVMPDGRRRLTDGFFARVRVAVADKYKALLVADRAILADQSLKYVLIVNKAKNNVVERVDIVVPNRIQENGMRVVQAGLKGDEWIIVEGVNRARPGVTVAPKEGPMPRRPTQ